MVSFNDPQKVTYLVGTDTKDIQQRQIFIEDQNGTLLSMESLYKKVDELIEKKKEELLPIMGLGSGLFGAEKSFGFMIGYVVKTLLISYEETAYKQALIKNPELTRTDFKLTIKMNETPVSRIEFKEYALKQLDELKELISNDEETAFKQFKNGSD